MKHPKALFIALFALIFWSACNPFKNLKDGEVLLNSNKLKVVTKYEQSVFKETIPTIIKPKPNRKILYFLRLNLTFNNWGFFPKTLGEEPVLLDTTLVEKNARLIKRFMVKEGYFNATVKDTIIYKRKHRLANVEYTVIGNEPYRINNISYEISDPILNAIIPSDASVNSLIVKGDIYDEDNIDKERERITTELKSRGYYYFNKGYIHFDADTQLNTHQLNIIVGVKRLNENKSSQMAGLLPENHHSYTFKNIYVQTDFNPRELISNVNKDTINYKDINFISSPGSPKYSFERLSQTIFLKKNDFYQINNYQETYDRIADLGMFKFINIRFDEVTHDTINGKYELNVVIQLSPVKRQSISIEGVGTDQGGALGISSNVDYRNKNTFTGFEVFDIRGKAALEAQKSFGTADKFFNIFNTFEWGPEVTLNFQKPLFPGSLFKGYSQHSNPKTFISSSYYQQIRPDYTRSVANITYGLNFKEPGKVFKKWNINLIDINYVNSKLDSSFQALLNRYNDPTIKNAYRPHVTTDFKLSYTYNNQRVNSKLRDYNLIFGSIEVSGLALDGYNLLPPMIKFLQPLQQDAEGRSKFLNQVYSEYIKPEIDFRFYHPFNMASMLAFRGMFSLGVPYGHSQTLPFEKSSYGGGANDIRAWIARNLGPGSYQNSSSIDQTGDIKLLVSTEYRFNMFWILEGAFFIDGGNIWLYNPDPFRPGADLPIKDISGKTIGPLLDKMFSETAFGGGYGIRMNFIFFIARVDFGIPFKDPSRPEFHRWIRTNELSLSRTKINFGIGFPF
ncbi:MAG: hypothetical protein WCL14_10420 [Bacteroidota bacterium]